MENQRENCAPLTPILNQRQGSILDTNIAYYKHAIENMIKEIRILENDLLIKEQCLKIQKSSIMDMKYHERNIACKFEVKLIKHAENYKLESKLEEKLEDVGNFLEKVMPLGNEIKKIKVEDKTLRSYILTRYRKICTEFELIENHYTTKVTSLKDKINKIKVYINKAKEHNKIVEHEARKCKHLWAEKIISVTIFIKDLEKECERLKQEPRFIQRETKIEISGINQRSKDKFTQVQHKVYLTRMQLEMFKKTSEIEFSRIQSINDKLRKSLQKKITSIISDKQFETNLPNEENKENHVTANELQTKIKNLLQESWVVTDMLNSTKKDGRYSIIQTSQEEQMQMKFQLEEEINNYETNIGFLKVRLQSLQDEHFQINNNLISLREKISLSTIQLQSTLEYHGNLIIQRDKLIRIKTNLENSPLKLKSQVEQTDGELSSLNNTISRISNNLFIENCNSIEEDDRIFQTYLAIENEQHFIVNKKMEIELKNLFDMDSEIRNEQQNLELLILNRIEESRILQMKINKEEILSRNILDEHRKICHSVNELIANVEQGRLVMDDVLNKRYSFLLSKIELEKENIGKLKTEIDKKLFAH